MDKIAKLIAVAKAARKQAKADYSGYAVGAAVLATNGAIYQGCNIESAAYSTTICAERVAIFAAIAAGARNFERLAVVTEDGGTPCGACRQVILEQCGALEIHVHALQTGATVEHNAGDLLPSPFAPKK